MGNIHLPSRRVRRWLVGVAVVAALGIAIKAQNTWVGEGISECSFDAQGPYAKVRVNNSLFGGPGAVDHQGVTVDFTYEGAWYASEGNRDVLPVLGSRTMFIQGHYPPRRINLNWDGGPKGIITVDGRTIRGVRQQVGRNGAVVPNDLQKIGCSIRPPTAGD